MFETGEGGGCEDESVFGASAHEQVDVKPVRTKRLVEGWSELPLDEAFVAREIKLGRN